MLGRLLRVLILTCISFSQSMGMDSSMESALQTYTSWQSKKCLIIEGMNRHEKMIRKVIETVSGTDTKVTTLANQIDYTDCKTLKNLETKEEKLFETIYQGIQKEVADTKEVSIVNLSGDISTSCDFLPLYDDEMEDLQDDIRKSEPDQLPDTLPGGCSEEGKIICKTYQEQVTKEEEKKTSLKRLEYEKKRETLEKGKEFYQKLFKEFEKQTLLIAAMGNRLKSNQLDTLFSPLRHAALIDKDFIKNTIFVINVTALNCLEEDSEIPHPLVMGPKKLIRHQEDSFYEAYKELFPPLKDNDFFELQESTIAVRGEWEKSSPEPERDHIHHTSAATAILSGFLVKIKNAFPRLSPYELKEAVLNSAEKDFNIPQSAYEQAQIAYEEDAKDEISNPERNEIEFWYRVLHSNNPIEENKTINIHIALENIKKLAENQQLQTTKDIDFQSFYGQGIFNAKRAFYYAELLNKHNDKRGSLSKDEEDFCSAKSQKARQEIFNKMLQKK